MVLPKQAVDQDVYSLALERTHICFDRYDRVAVSFSGGKDSTVCLMVALEVHKQRGITKPLEVFFWDEEAIHPQTIEYMTRVSAWPEISLRWLCVPHLHRNACSKREPYWHPWAPEKKHLWCRDLPPNVITHLDGYASDVPANRLPVPQLNHALFPNLSEEVGIIMGIRAAESLRRYRSVAHRTYDNWIARDTYSKNCSMLKPVYDWTTDDVWTAPAKFGWDYNRTYDLLNAAGVSRHDQRVCPPYGEEPLRGLWQYAECWPELWEKMINRVPGAATAARYSRSPLYGFANVEKPEGKTWQEAIKDEVMKFPREIQVQLSDRIRQMMQLHYKKSKNKPIPEQSEHGVSWAWLYMIAKRGDLKERRTVKYEVDVVETRHEGS